jgi:hypothetical protein
MQVRQLYKSKAVLNKAVDLHSRRYAFRGLAREPPRSFAPAGSHSARASRRSQAPSAPINRFQNQQSPLTQPLL